MTNAKSDSAVFEKMSEGKCPVCRADQPRHFAAVDGLDYWICGSCRAVFLDRARLPKADEERARYLLHRNDPHDPGYRRFLNRLAEPLMKRIRPRSAGLDYGCGPGPALAMMLSEAGHSMSLYDPFFHPDESAIRRKYDFITCTETVEHFHRPYEEFEKLDALLRPAGLLGIMTCFLTDESRFADWHYRRDPTHVVFYRAETFERLAALFSWDCEISSKDIVIMRKRENIGSALSKII